MPNPPPRPNATLPGVERHRGRLRGRPAYWLCQLAGWGGLVVCLTAGGIANDPGLYRRIWLLDWLALGTAGVLASHFLRWMILSARERAFGARLALWLLPRLLTGLAAMWALRGLFVMGLEPSPFNNPQWGNPVYILEIAVIPLHLGGLLFCLRLLSPVRDRSEGTAAPGRRAQGGRTARAQGADQPPLSFQQSKYAAVLHPARAHAPAQGGQVRSLADLLRASLTADQQAGVPFAQELTVIESYLALQQLRFEGRLLVRRSIAPEALRWPVPPFLVQGLVENAVKFGIAPHEAGGEISLAAEVRDEVFHAVITNPGQINAASDFKPASASPMRGSARAPALRPGCPPGAAPGGAGPGRGGSVDSPPGPRTLPVNPIKALIIDDERPARASCAGCPSRLPLVENLRARRRRRRSRAQVGPGAPALTAHLSRHRDARKERLRVPGEPAAAASAGHIHDGLRRLRAAGLRRQRARLLH